MWRSAAPTRRTAGPNKNPLNAIVPDVAKVLGISRAGAYELAHSRDFPSMKVGSRIIIPKDKFLLWIEKQCGEG